VPDHPTGLLSKEKWGHDPQRRSAQRFSRPCLPPGRFPLRVIHSSPASTHPSYQPGTPQQKSVVRSRSSTTWPGGFNESEGIYPQDAKHWSYFRANRIDQGPQETSPTGGPRSRVPYLPPPCDTPDSPKRCLARRASVRLQPWVETGLERITCLFTPPFRSRAATSPGRS
jgi:hypothetical protein